MKLGIQGLDLVQVEVDELSGGQLVLRECVLDVLDGGFLDDKGVGKEESGEHE